MYPKIILKYLNFKQNHVGNSWMIQNLKDAQWQQIFFFNSEPKNKEFAENIIAGNNNRVEKATVLHFTLKEQMKIVKNCKKL